MIKRILSFGLALSLTTSLSATAYAAEIETTEGTEIFSEIESTGSAEANEFVFLTQTDETQESTESLISVEETISDPTEDSIIPTTIPETEPTEVTTPSTEATEPTNSTEEATTEPTESSTFPTTQPETEPTQPSTTPEDYVTEPTNPSEDITDTEPTEPLIPTVLEIDTENIYEGMTKAYEDGYVPTIKDGYMSLVLPLIPSGAVHNDRVKVSLSLGSSASSPFVIANYEKVFELETIVPENSNIPQTLFLIHFDLKMSSERRDGVYPVTVNVFGYDEAGNAIAYIYTIYVTITDGKAETIKTTVETPTAEPVVYISKSEMLPEKPMAGEEFTLTITLKNSLTNKSIRNMLVTVDTGNMQINLLEDSNIFQINSISAGGDTTLTLRLMADTSLPAGKYTINFSFKYDSSKTLNLSSSGSAIIEVKQPANMELVMPRFSDSVTVGETIPLSLQVMNMGRDPMYNVRCVVSGFGFAPSNTGYIGKMEAGSSSTTKVDLYIIALNSSKGNENGSQYGDTTGTITLIYEDESGLEYQQETEFETTVKRPIVSITQTDNTQEVAEKAASQWWISALILGGVILAAGIVFFLIRQCRKKRFGKYL